MAGVNAREAARGVVRRAVVLTGGEGDQLQRRGPASDIITQPAALSRFDRRIEAAVKKLLRLLVGKGQLLAAHFEQLFAHAQVGNPQLRQVTREHNQGQVFRLMAQEETHCIVDHRVGNQMVIINHQVERALPFGQFDKQLREE